MTNRHFEPSTYLLNQMLANAMAKCDADVAHENLAQEQRQNERAARAWAAEAEANRRRRIWGDI